MTTLHIYARVSTSTQETDGSSIESQIAAGEEYAQKNGMMPKVWNEGGKSSAGDSFVNRPVLAEVLAKIDSGEIEHLYVWNTDRLSRKPHASKGIQTLDHNWTLINQPQLT